MKRKVLLIVYIILYLLMSSYLLFRYSITLPKNEDVGIIKEIFDLDENDNIIFLLKEVTWLAPELKAIYISNKVFINTFLGY